MNGHVDEFGRALVTVDLARDEEDEPARIDAWIDTPFNGELVVPSSLIESLDLVRTAATEATLADGTTVLLNSYECWLDWFGGRRRTDVVANEGTLPLLGVGLLIGHRLQVDYVRMLVAIE